MKLNPYGLVGILFIAGMAGSVAYHWNQHDSWNVFVFASFSLVFYCFGLLLYFNSIRDIKFSIGCHLALIFLIVGTWLPPTYNDTILFPDQYTGKGPSESTLFLATYFFVCWLAGMGCSFLLLDLHGLVGILFIAGMVGSVAYLWNQPDWWNIFIFASVSVICYSIASVVLTTFVDKDQKYWLGINRLRLLIGCHLALIFLIVGTWLPPTHNDTILFPDQYTGKGPSESTLFLITYFFVCWLVGMGCSFLLFRPYNMAGNQINVVKEDNHLDGRRVGLVVGGIVLVLSAFYLFFLEGTFGACFALFAGGGGFVCIGQGLFAKFR